MSDDRQSDGYVAALDVAIRGISVVNHDPVSAHRSASLVLAALVESGVVVLASDVTKTLSDGEFAWLNRAERDRAMKVVEAARDVPENVDIYGEDGSCSFCGKRPMGLRAKPHRDGCGWVTFTAALAAFDAAQEQAVKP